MGYDIERFLSTVNEALACCICRDVLQDPVQAPCEHAYCKTCIEAWLVHETSCPEDRRPLALSALRPLFRYMRNDLNRLEIRCRNYTHGCENVSRLEFLESHERNCGFEKQKCPNRRCSFEASRGALDEHVMTCEYNQKECPHGCGLLITHSADVDHNCIRELRTGLDVLRSEVTCRYEEQKHELELRLDMQRNHMIQKEATLQSQIDALTFENSRLAQNVKLLMDMEMARRHDIETLELEKKELMELLRQNVAQATPSTPGPVPGRPKLKRSNTLTGKVTTL